VRTLFQILEGARGGFDPSPGESRAAMLALARLVDLLHRDLLAASAHVEARKLEEALVLSLRRCRACLECSPEAWLAAGGDVPVSPRQDPRPVPSHRPPSQANGNGVAAPSTALIALAARTRQKISRDGPFSPGS
jgi:hypothetical protein